MIINKILHKKHLLLNEIGLKGQEKIAVAKVLIIGLGGLASPALRYLASSGVNHFGIIDDDIIELDNLPRQNNYLEKDIDKAKIDVSKKLIKSLNKNAKIASYYIHANYTNLSDIINKYNYIIDATDNFKSKFSISDLCYQQKKILISAAFTAFTGYVAVYKAWYNNSLPCFRCFHHDHLAQINDKACYNQGVFSAGVGVLGTMMAAETLKEIISPELSSAGKIFLFNFKNNNHRSSILYKNESCRCSIEDL
jgi:molybdopterin/thiamine biosynthesis adenylyltransferase